MLLGEHASPPVTFQDMQGPRIPLSGCSEEPVGSRGDLAGTEHLLWAELGAHLLFCLLVIPSPLFWPTYLWSVRFLRVPSPEVSPWPRPGQ